MSLPRRREKAEARTLHAISARRSAASNEENRQPPRDSVARLDSSTLLTYGSAGFFAANGAPVDVILRFWNIISHLDKHLSEWSASMGGWLYALLFAIIFCETGLVVTPFLPGDSLLFATGAVCALEGSHVSAALMIPLLIVAAVLGDAVNYSIGRQIGPRVFTSETSKLLNRNHLLRTQAFYEKYGGKAIIIARFVPIVRTFAPFVAGVGQMRYSRFFLFNVVGAVAWVGLFIPAGMAFGNIPTVQRNFHLVIFAIIFLSILPAVIEYLRERSKAQSGAPTI
jgi:membrane-associated protein